MPLIEAGQQQPVAEKGAPPCGPPRGAGSGAGVRKHLSADRTPSVVSAEKETLQQTCAPAATVVRESNELERCEWSCSSCFLYAVCGREEGAPPLPPPGPGGEEELKKSLKKVGKALARTQTPSAVP